MSSTDGSKRGTFFNLPPALTDALLEIAVADQKKASAIHGNYRHLQQNTSPIPKGLKDQLASIISDSLQGIGYNNSGHGVGLIHAFLYTHNHHRQDPHQDYEPSAIKKDAISSDVRVKQPYNNAVPFVAFIPLTFTGMELLVWPEFLGEQVMSRYVYIPLDKGLLGLGELMHSGTFGRGPDGQFDPMIRLHLAVNQDGFGVPPPKIVQNYYKDSSGPFHLTHLFRPQDSARFPSQERLKRPGCEVVREILHDPQSDDSDNHEEEDYDADDVCSENSRFSQPLSSEDDLDEGEKDDCASSKKASEEEDEERKDDEPSERGEEEGVEEFSSNKHSPRRGKRRRHKPDYFSLSQNIENVKDISVDEDESDGNYNPGHDDSSSSSSNNDDAIPTAPIKSKRPRLRKPAETFTVAINSNSCGTVIRQMHLDTRVSVFFIV